MRKILIVSPRFPPTSAADHHRVRMMLPYLAEHGWEATVIAVRPEHVEAPVEPDLLLTIPANVNVVRCNAIPQSLTRRFGFGSLTFRSYSSLRKAGDEILGASRFDLVFFSTTEFGTIPLGRRWRKKYNVPFVVDLQDPWVNNYYEETGAPRPGGRFKHSVTQFLARRQEGTTLAEAAGIISVSPRYVEQITERHADLKSIPASVIPFAGASADFEAAERLPDEGLFNLPRDGRRHWVYAGTAPPGIRASVVPFFLALREAIDAGVIERDSVRCHFIGTDYAPADSAKPRVRPIAAELGLDDVVCEHPSRIGYLETLRCLKAADALIVFGWDDPGYTASKIYPYILAHRPLLSILSATSSAAGVVEGARAGVSITFDSDVDPATIAQRITAGWFATTSFDAVPETDWNAFDQFTAETMTSRVAAFFESVA